MRRPHRGYAFAFLFVLKPFLLEILRRAMGEATLAAGVAITLVVTERALVVWRRAGIGATVSFVLPNPYLYPNPPSRTAKMFENRVSEMTLQLSLFPDARVDGVVDRAAAAGRRVFSEHAVLRFSGAWIITAGLSVVGLRALVRSALRSLANRAPDASFVIVAVGASQVVPALMTPLDWNRYYLFPVLFANLCIAIGVAETVRLATLTKRNLTKSVAVTTFVVLCVASMVVAHDPIGHAPSHARSLNETPLPADAGVEVLGTQSRVTAEDVDRACYEVLFSSGSRMDNKHDLAYVMADGMATVLENNREDLARVT